MTKPLFENMTIQQVKQYCMSLDGAKEELTSDGKWTVFCKDNNIFLLIFKHSPFPTITIKLPADRGLALQDEYNIVSPSYLNLQNWVDIDIDNNFPSTEIEAWINESYDLMLKESGQSDKDKYISLSSIIGIR